jgi:hypothetical protein
VYVALRERIRQRLCSLELTTSQRIGRIIRRYVMSSPHDDDRWADPDSVSLSKQPQDADEAPFDPYRYGAPEHPVPPEYAPPGYVPPPPPQTPPPPPGPERYAGYGYPARQPYPPPPPPAPGYRAYGSNAKAIAALIFGIASIVLCWLSIFDLLPIVVAVVFGILGINEAARRGDGRGRRMAIAGIICAGVGTLLAIVLTVYFVHLIKPCLDYPSGSAAQNHCIEQKF